MCVCVCVCVTGRLDIRDLPWEDRERVLRLLFAKINNQAQQMFFSNLPQHPLETVSVGCMDTSFVVVHVGKVCVSLCLCLVIGVHHRSTEAPLNSSAPAQWSSAQ